LAVGLPRPAPTPSVEVAIVEALRSVSITTADCQQEKSRRVKTARQIGTATGQIAFSTVFSTVGQNFAAKLRNSVQRTAKAKLRITWRQQRYEKQ
jgi:hypothetical protein